MAYKLMKRIIERGGYDKADVLDKLDTFYAAGRLTKAEYEELVALVRQPIVPASSELGQELIKETAKAKK